METIKMTHATSNYTFEFKVINSAMGYKEAVDKYNRLGLIGRVYILCSDGSAFIYSGN